MKLANVCLIILITISIVGQLNAQMLTLQEHREQAMRDIPIQIEYLRNLIKSHPEAFKESPQQAALRRQAQSRFSRKNSANPSNGGYSFLKQDL